MYEADVLWPFSCGVSADNFAIVPAANGVSIAQCTTGVTTVSVVEDTTEAISNRSPFSWAEPREFPKIRYTYTLGIGQNNPSSVSCGRGPHLNDCLGTVKSAFANGCVRFRMFRHLGHIWQRLHHKYIDISTYIYIVRKTCSFFRFFFFFACRLWQIFRGRFPFECPRLWG